VQKLIREVGTCEVQQAVKACGVEALQVPAWVFGGQPGGRLGDQGEIGQLSGRVEMGRQRRNGAVESMDGGGFRIRRLHEAVQTGSPEGGCDNLCIMQKLAAAGAQCPEPQFGPRRFSNRARSAHSFVSPLAQAPTGSGGAPRGDFCGPMKGQQRL
jgi:hypothetical protein